MTMRDGGLRAEGPLVLGISGSMRFGTAAEQALRIALDRAEELGGRTQLIPGSRLIMASYDDEVEPEAKAQWLLEAVAEADGIILCSPSYHGGMPGLLKNALDYLELTSTSPAPYFHGLPVGTIATGDGWQGPNSTLLALRQSVHALRGWPTPLGVAHNVSDGGIADARDAIRLVAEQVMDFARMRRAAGG